MTDGGRTVLMPRSRVPAGTQLNGIYRVDQPIAAGGMGEVYKGYNIQTGDPVAIKMIRSDLAENEAALQLFRKEASALHNLHHEAIVRYYIFTVDPQLNRAYLAMEYVDGISLKDLLVRGPLSFEQVCILQKRIAAGLHAAHKMGIIHRDVSPDNVLAPSGDLSEAKILDFGIARSTKAGEQTVIGSGFAGKYNYVSPEQLGMFGGNVTGKSDIYSLGLVLAECMIGRPIDMSGSQVDVIDKRRMIPDLSAIDPRFRPLLTEMLSPHPDDRPDDMATVAQWIPSKKGTKSKTTRTPPGQTANGNRTGSKISLIAAAIAALVGFGGAGTYFGMTMLNGTGNNSQLAQEERLAQQNQQAEAAARAAETKRLADAQVLVAQKREAETRESAARVEAERLRQIEEQRVIEERRQADVRKQEEDQRAAQLRKQAEEQMTIAARQEAARKEQEAARKEAEAKAADAKAAELKRMEDEKKAVETKRIDDEKRAADARKKLEDDKKIAEAKAAETKRLEEEKKAAETKRIDDEKRAAEARRKQEVEAKAAEAKRIEDEKKAAEALKREDEIRASALMIAEAKRIEEDRIREEARRVEQERVAQEQKNLIESQALAQSRKLEAEQAAARDAEAEKTRIAQEAAQARWDAELAAALARQGIALTSPTIGAAPQQLALADPAAPRAEVDPTITRRSVQTELSRLGCYAGAVDGNASKPLNDAIRRYRDRSKTSGANDPADAALLQELQVQIPERGACECLPGQTAAKNNCTAKAPVRAKKPEKKEPVRQTVRRPAPEPRRQAERPAPRQAAPAPRPVPAAPAAAARPASRPNIGGIGF